MQRKFIFIIFVFVALIVGSVAFYLSSNKYAEPQSVQLKQSDFEIPNETVVANDRYIVYAKNNFEEAKDKKRVLYFHADWCPVCRPLDREFQAMMDKIPQDVVIFKTDYDKEIELKKRFIITYQHTFVQVDEQGNEIKKWSGGNFDDVISNID